MNPFHWLRRPPTLHGRRAAQMTWAKSSVGRTFSRTGLFLKRHLWVWPILAVVLLLGLRLLVRQSLETTMRENLSSQLETLVNVDTAMLETWIKVQKSNVESLANNIDVRQTIYPLIDPDATDAKDPAAAREATEALREKLAKSLGPALTAHRYEGYVLADKQRQIVAATRTESIGRQDPPEYSNFLTKALDGVTNLAPPYSSTVALKDERGQSRTGVPTMFVAAPIRDDSFQVVGVLALRLNPEKEFSRIMSLGRFGQSGETYAFDKNGRMVSNSRFDDQLILLGLLPDEADARSILQVLVRDPGGNITEGYRPTQRRHELPPTIAVSEALAGRSGVNVAGYRDYRGVPVVGAWTWLPEADLGVVTEIDYAEAFHPLTILQRTFLGLLGLLALCALAIFVFTIVVARLRREAQKAAIEAQQIGQYKLEKKIGSGGMGVVYKAQHAMLRRPTAVKMLDVDKVNEGSVERFEREVQITSKLNNPHTVAIFDFGRTPEGVFYYAMEYLDGIDLQTLVERYGPQSPARVIHILQQVCSSLYEAHSLGLVHRDIKPANIMLNRRGGEPDVVKVLDFGLVKAIDDEKRARSTQQGALTGTPLYMSPEAIEMPSSVDARSDLYAVGAVAYFMLTGAAVFDADNLVELCQKQVGSQPPPPSQRSPHPIPAELENAIMACLEKSRAKRPQTARDLAQLLSRCAEAKAWAVEEADAWWGRHERGHASVSLVLAPSGSHTASNGQDETIDITVKR